jgi:hypothetical protein
MTALTLPRVHSVVEVAALTGDDPFALSNFWFITAVRDGKVSGYLIMSDYARDINDFDRWTEVNLEEGHWREVAPE